MKYPLQSSSLSSSRAPSTLGCGFLISLLLIQFTSRMASIKVPDLILDPSAPAHFVPSCIVVSVCLSTISPDPSTWIHLRFLLGLCLAFVLLGLPVPSRLALLCPGLCHATLLSRQDQIIRFPSASRMAIIVSLLAREKKRVVSTIRVFVTANRSFRTSR